MRENEGKRLKRSENNIYTFTNFEMQKLSEYQTVLKTEKTLSCDNMARILSYTKSF